MKKVLITGGDGFTGKYMNNQLASAGYDVVVLGNNDLGNPNIINCDLTNQVAVQEIIKEHAPQWVIHLAAISFVAHGHVDEIYKVNVLGTRNLLNSLASLKIKPEVVLLASSANVYGHSGVTVIGEENQLMPTNDYGVSKLTMEYMARLWLDKLPIIITRPFNYTGVGQDKKFLIPKIVDHFIRKEPEIELGNIDVEREFSDVRKLCDIYLKLLQAPAAIGEVFNICSGKAYSLREIIEMMEKISGYKIKVKINQNFVRSNEIKRLVGDNTKLHAFIGKQDYPEMLETLQWMSSGQ